MKNNEYIKIGQIAKSHGIRGNLKVNIFSEEPENILKYYRVYMEKENEYIEMQINKIQFSKKQAIINLKNIQTKEEADKYKNKFIYIAKEDLEALEENTYYLIDLIGIEVFKEDGEYIGNIYDIDQTSPTDIYYIKREKQKDLLLPARKEYIKKVDIKTNKMIVNIEALENEI